MNAETRDACKYAGFCLLLIGVAGIIWIGWILDGSPPRITASIEARAQLSQGFGTLTLIGISLLFLSATARKTAGMRAVMWLLSGFSLLFTTFSVLNLIVEVFFG